MVVGLDNRLPLIHPAIMKVGANPCGCVSLRTKVRVDPSRLPIPPLGISSAGSRFLSRPKGDGDIGIPNAYPHWASALVRLFRTANG
jgi:hypothetical protein